MCQQLARALRDSLARYHDLHLQRPIMVTRKKPVCQNLVVGQSYGLYNYFTLRTKGSKLYPMQLPGCVLNLVLGLHASERGIMGYQSYKWFFKNRSYELLFLHTKFWTQNLGPKIEIQAHLGTKIAITFFNFFCLEAVFYWSMVIIFCGDQRKNVPEKNTCRGMTKVMPRASCTLYFKTGCF